MPGDPSWCWMMRRRCSSFLSQHLESRDLTPLCVAQVQILGGFCFGLLLEGSLQGGLQGGWVVNVADYLHKTWDDVLHVVG